MTALDAIPEAREELRDVLEERLTGKTLDERLDAVLELVGPLADSILAVHYARSTT